MKFNGKFVLKNIGGTYYAVPLGEASKTIKGMIKLNDSGAFIWEKLEKELSEDEIVAELTKDFDISEETARKDFQEFTNSLKKVNILV